MIQRLPIVFAQVKTRNSSESFLNKIRHIFCINQNKSLKKYVIA